VDNNKQPLPPQTPEELKDKYGLAPDEIAWIQRNSAPKKK
jgi:hypothetical protein